MAFFCEAYQGGDQMVCRKCKLVWGVNDAHPPYCKEIHRKNKRVLSRGQTKLESWIEITLNTGSGFVLSYLIYRSVVFPYMLKMSAAEQAWWVTWLFTVVSLIRSYVWRRFFNAGTHKLVHAACVRFLAWGTGIKCLSKTRKTSVKRTK